LHEGGGVETARRDGVVLAGRAGQGATNVGRKRGRDQEFEDQDPGAGGGQEKTARNDHRQLGGPSPGRADCEQVARSRGHAVAERPEATRSGIVHTMATSASRASKRQQPGAGCDAEETPVLGVVKVDGARAKAGGGLDDDTNQGDGNADRPERAATEGDGAGDSGAGVHQSVAAPGRGTQAGARRVGGGVGTGARPFEQSAGTATQVGLNSGSFG
jgi:hypothetical protein